MDWEGATNIVLLIYGIGFGVSLVGLLVIRLCFKKADPGIVTVVFLSFFVAGLVAFTILRALALSEDAAFFTSIAIGIVIAGVIGLVSRRMFAQHRSAAETKYNLIHDPMSFGERRRQRLNKKRTR